MKTVSILPFLCVLAAAAPTLSGPGKEVDIDRRQATDDGNDAGLGGLLGGSDSENGLLSGLRKRQSSSNNNNNNDNDDSLANLLDGSTLAVDGNGQNVDIADLGSLLRNRRRQLHVPAPGATRNSDDNSNSEQVANVLDGSAAGIDRNAQNISVVKRITKRQLLGGLGHEEGGEVEGNGNGDDDESLLNVLDGDTADVSRNIQNVTILRRHPRTSSSTSVSKRGWLSALFLGRRGTPTTSSDSNNGDNDDALANVLDGSAAGVDDNAQGVSVLRRRQASPSSSSAAASTPTPTPSASASAVPIAQDPPAAAPAPAPAARAEEPASHPVVNAADNDNNDNNNNNASNDDALLNAANNSGTSVDRNLQNITILRQKRQGGRSHPDVDDSGNADDDDTLANVGDGSALKADGNGQGVDVGDLL